jgi:serine-type D-Ala-D-Ala carboxypeptidase (penicillin-binding protein 5/6)
MYTPSSASIGIESRRHKSSNATFLQLMLCVVLTLTLFFSQGLAPAYAAILASDSVDGVPVSQLGAIRQAMPDVKLKAGVLVDGDGRVLWSRQPDADRSMASLTKIMTAVVALENTQLTDTVLVPRAATRVGESTSFLRAGDKLSMQELLEALLVKSGNDASVAIALHVSGDTDAFVALMNKKAVELGLTSTHFTNPHGLDEPGHHTSARDLGVLARYAMSKPGFRSIVGMKSVTIGAGRRKETLPSTNVLIGNYQGISGIKTGFTKDAGYCVINSAERNDIELYAVVLGTATESARFRDARELLDWGFAHYRPQSLATSGTVLAEAPVSDYLDVTVPAAVSADSTVPILDLNGPITRTVTVAAVRAPVKAGQHVGVATFSQNGRLIASLPLISTQDVRRPNPLLRVWIAIVRAWRVVF